MPQRFLRQFNTPRENKTMSRQGWEYWADANLIHTGQDGPCVFAKDGYECHCPPGTEPGDADTDVCKADLWKWAD